MHFLWQTDAINAAVREAYKKQELAGGPSTNAVPGMEVLQSHEKVKGLCVVCGPNVRVNFSAG